MKHNFPQKTWIFCNEILTKEQIIVICKLALDADITVCVDPKELVDNQKKWHYRICIDHDGDLTEYTIDDNSEFECSFDEFCKFFEGKGVYKGSFKEKLKLSGDYKAIVTKENVKVGCQTFTHDKIKELYKLSQKALKS